MNRIEITVSPDGQTTVATQGFIGSSCQEATRLLEQALGRRLGEQLTGEFFAAAETEQAQHESS